MRVFRRRKLRKLLAAGNVAEALAFLGDPEPRIARAAWGGVLEILGREPARLADAEVADPLFDLRERRPDLWPDAFERLVATSDPRLLPEAMDRATGDPRGALGRASFLYLARLIDAAPDALRARCAGDEEFLKALGRVLDSSETIGEPVLQAAVALVGFLDLWRDDAACRGCLRLFCRSRWAQAPVPMDRILTSLLPFLGTELVEPLLYQHGVDPENKDLEARVGEAIALFGEAARGPLMSAVRDYKSTVRSQTQTRTERTPPYYASQKALQLLGQVIQGKDREVTLFLTEIVADTKLAASGLHKKYAREALLRIG